MKCITLENLTSFATKFSEKITEKFVKKESGKGLSSNDYTAAEKQESRQVQMLIRIQQRPGISIFRQVDLQGSF